MKGKIISMHIVLENMFGSLGQILRLFYCILHGMFHEVRYKLLEERECFLLDEENVEGQVVVITGANRGLGYFTALELAKRKAVVIMGCRDMTKGTKAMQEIKTISTNDTVDLFHLDVADMDSVRSFSKQVSDKYPKIKLLVNNAGNSGKCNGDLTTKQGFNANVASNYLGHFLLTNLLTKNLISAAPSRIVSISANCQLCARLNFEDLMMDNDPKGLENTLLYSNTKYMMSLFMHELGDRLCASGVNTYSLCPGLVDTPIHYQIWPVKMVFKIVGFSAEQGAREFIIPCALDKNLSKETGLMYHFRKPFDAVNRRMDDEVSMKLWDWSCKLVNL